MTRGKAAADTDNLNTNKIEESVLEPHNLSRSGNVVATADVRGNLGPARYVVQASYS